MNIANYQCLNCQQSTWQTDATLWRCESCGHKYPCVNGIPQLYVECNIGRRDRELRDYFYDGLLGTYYQYLMPFLSLPVRPARQYWKGWATYALIVFFLVALAVRVANLLVTPGSFPFSISDIAAAVVLLSITYFFFKHPYLLFLIVLAIPVKISLVLSTFKPAQSFTEIHARLIQQLLKRQGTLQVLDISTGTCNSLYRHGWMKLNADYTGVDLSETMIRQGQAFMARQQVPMDFVLADAAQLPLRSGIFDVVLNYGAVNALTDPRLALEEMARVARKGGLVLFLDEQLYESASLVERLYFSKVLSSHNVIHRCPVESMPFSLANIEVHQVYEFYYLCTSSKS
jgi:methyltransferase family protein